MRQYPSICVEGLMKNMKNHSHDSWCMDHGFNMGHPYKKKEYYPLAHEI
jgi:hypothetical protein